MALLGAIGSPMAKGDEGNPIELSATLRERATYRSAIDFDDEDPDSGWFWTQRLSVDAEAVFSPRLTGKASLVSALLRGNETIPIEQNNLDVQEAYLDIALAAGRLRVGRQEASLGSQRLISTRDGTAVRRTWDGLRYSIEGGDWVVDALALSLVDVSPNGVFNDEPDSDRLLGGVYATRDAGSTSLDVYYLWDRINDRPTVQGVADQRRHTLGARVFGARGPWFWNHEAMVQFGEHGDDDIRAWSLATNTGFRFEGAWAPEVMLSVNVASGDDDPTDDKLETFDALYPRGSYFSEVAVLGPSNFYNINPYFRAQPREGIALSVDVNWYWRLHEEDAVYGPPGVPLRFPQGATERLVARAVSASVEWEVNDRWFIGIVATHSEPQGFIRDTGPRDTIRFIEFTVEAEI